MYKQNGKPSLSGMMHHPVSEIKRLGLTVEASQTASLQEMKPYADVFASAHAPYMKEALRLNPAADDESFREESIKIIEDYIEIITAFDLLTQVNVHFGCVRRVEPEQTIGKTGTYENQIKSFQRIADFARNRGKEIVLENSGSYWSGVSTNTTFDQVDWTKQSVHFGTDPEEWIRICEDVNRDNVGLCLDTSHACMYSHRFPEDERGDVLFSFLQRPDLIRHVHWSDNYPYDVRGRSDSHEILGRGDEPIEFHKAVKELDALILLESNCTVKELEEQLEFIDKL